MTTADNTSLQRQEVLLQHLQQAALFPHPVEAFTLLQTHISWVLLTGPYAYKFKKPVDLGFLDFSTLALRKHFCEEELRLNQRLAPQLYLEVITITGSPEHPVLNGQGPVLEYAVRMRQFPQAAQLDEVLARGELNADHIDKLAEVVADFHQTTAQADPKSSYGDPQQVYQPVQENFEHIRRSPGLEQYASRLDALEEWCQARFKQLQATLNERRHSGYIREGHGDMHLRNLALLDGKVVPFDCLEFNPELRWIDVINDIAFLLMDLDDRRQAPLAWRLLNRYLELTGDYRGVTLLNFYKVYRALVRAKVDAIRLGQPHLAPQEQENTCRDFLSYIELAETYTRKPSPVLVITRGLSGSGKSRHSQSLLEMLGAIRIRSDVERKRLFKDEARLYDKQITQQVYQTLAELSGELLSAGQHVIVDATFLDIDQITPFRQLAVSHGVPFRILEFTARPDTLRERVNRRKADYSDATVKVLEQQLQHWQALPADMQDVLISLDTEQAIDIQQLNDTLLNN